MRLCLRQHYHLNSNLYFMKQVLQVPATLQVLSQNPHTTPIWTGRGRLREARWLAHARRLVSEGTPDLPAPWSVLFIMDRTRGVLSAEDEWAEKDPPGGVESGTCPQERPDTPALLAPRRELTAVLPEFLKGQRLCQILPVLIWSWFPSSSIRKSPHLASKGPGHVRCTHASDSSLPGSCEHRESF